jgi:hypothetical protein
MSIESSIHCERQRIGMKVQPEHIQDLSDIDILLGQQGLDHPYDPKMNLGLLEAVAAFASGAAGPLAHSTNLNIYRLAPLRHLVEKCSSWGRPGFDADQWADDELLKALQDEFVKQGRWLNLADFATGHYRGWRNVTFWTDGEHRPDLTIISSAYACGMPIDWIAEQAVVLRCRVSGVAHLMHLPSCIDGVTSPIFEPVDWRSADAPISGTAIDISDVNSLRRGWSEYTLTAVPVQDVDFAPVNIGATAKAATTEVGLDEALLLSVLQYYRKL